MKVPFAFPFPFSRKATFHFSLLRLSWVPPCPPFQLGFITGRARHCIEFHKLRGAMVSPPAFAAAVAVVAVLLCASAAANPAGGPHMADLSVLLPPRMTKPVEYRLIGGDGCFSWYSSVAVLCPHFFCFGALRDRSLWSAVLRHALLRWFRGVSPRLVVATACNYGWFMFRDLLHALACFRQWP